MLISTPCLSTLCSDWGWGWKSNNTKYSLEGLRLKLKFQYFGYLMQRASSLEKILMVRKIEGKREGSGRG